MDKEQRLASALKNCGSKRGYRGDGGQQIRPEKQRKGDLDGRDEALKRSEGSLEAVERKLTEARKEMKLKKGELTR